ncbi:MAG: hypothetical protein J5938_01030 [Clostridia bacterium]|nr:hypothetical protein [Clostridia bacterium]
MDIDKEVRRFKMELLRKMPFYGDIVMRLPIVENERILTACTDGGKIEYNPRFLALLTQGQRNFVLMHEIFHVLLFHCKRHGERNPRIWNTAADIIVNSILMKLTNDMKEASIAFEQPSDGIFANVGPEETVENLYEQLLADNKRMTDDSGTVLVRLNNSWRDRDPVKMDVPDDIIFRDPENTEAGIGHNLFRGAAGPGSGREDKAETGLSEAMLLQIIRESASANRSGFGSYYVPDQLFGLTESKRIKWQTLLRDFFVEELSDESSYTTPERKYLHMDIILPGYGRSEEKIEEVWAFVDSSISIGKDAMEQFLTQLYRIAKEFKCIFNICYWDTKVTDVYRKIRKEDDILKSLPRHSGGTDINCVYRWLKDNKVRPDIMLILTDGYFGSLDSSLFVRSLGKKTILVLSGSIPVNDDMKRIGRITKLE